MEWLLSAPRCCFTKGTLVISELGFSGKGKFEIYCNDFLLALFQNGVAEQIANGVEVTKKSNGSYDLRYDFNLSQSAVIKMVLDKKGASNFIVTMDVSETKSYVRGDPVKLATDGNKITIPKGTEGCVFIEVEPIWSKVTRTDPSENSQTVKELGEHLITINPEQYKYEKSGSLYSVKLEISDLKILSIKSLQEKYIYTFNAPQNLRSGTGNVVLRNATDNETDGTAAAKIITKKIYGRLGNDTTVFLVQYKKKTTDNYSYIGVPESNIYEADENNLAGKLDEIWEKIKNLAGYSTAKIVP